MSRAANPFSDLEHNVARDRDVRLYKETEDLVSRFKTEQPHDVLLATSDQLVCVQPKRR
jgi:hypothetical protein